MQGSDTLRLLDNVSVPPGLDVQVTGDTDEFMNLKAQLNNVTARLFGTCYRQGGRLHFATGMSMRDYAKMVKIDHAAKGSTIDDLEEHTNRPREPAHGKAIGAYLAETACQGLPFILPSFLVNYGLGWKESDPKAQLTIFAGTHEALAWPAIFEPPTDRLLPVTDGGHRSDEIDAKLRSAAAGRLPENGISVVFVFEDKIQAYQQDFTDCAKAKAIAKSLTASWDRREIGKRFGIELVTGNAHLKKVVDATSNSVNLGNNATKAWSMNALQSAISGVYTGEARLPNDDYDTARLSDFFDHAFAKVPILSDVANGTSAASYRNATPDRGGCVLLRGVGPAVLTQAYLYALGHGVAFDAMGDHLAAVDWFVIKPGAPEQGPTEDAHTYVHKHAHPCWLNMLAMMAGDRRFRLKGTKGAAEASFRQIVADLGLPA